MSEEVEHQNHEQEQQEQQYKQDQPQENQEQNQEQMEQSKEQQQPQQQKQQSKGKPIVPHRDGPQEGQLIFDFEVCQNCDQHAWNTHHDETKYTNLFLESQQAIEASIPNSYCTFNEKKRPGTGAFEVSHKGIIIFSKKNSGLFPQVQPLVERIKLFLDDLENKRDVSKWATKKEKKFEPPKQIKERPTFQTYMKQKEEQERKLKEQREEEARLKAEQEEKDRIEQERLEEEQRIQQQKEEEERLKKEEEDRKQAEEKAAEEQRIKLEQEKIQQEEAKKQAELEQQYKEAEPEEKEGEKAVEKPAE